MIPSIHRLLLRVFGGLPRFIRRRIVRFLYPSFTVGAMCIIERDNGDLLFVRQSYRRRWGVPGGLLQRREDPASGARREVMEEVGIDVELLGEPAVVVDAHPRRVDVIYRARPIVGDPGPLTPRSPEILEARWFAPDELPELQDETASAMVALARARTDSSQSDSSKRYRDWAS